MARIAFPSGSSDMSSWFREMEGDENARTKAALTARPSVAYISVQTASTRPITMSSSVRSRSSPQPRSPRQRVAIDPLALAGVNGGEDEEEDAAAAAGQRRGGRRNRMPGDIPPVRDATGEKVMEQFEAFLRE